jgi:hypothetical protein
MTTEAFLVEKLLATPVVTDIIGDRVFPNEVAQGELRPALLYMLVAETPVNTTSGVCLYESSILFDCLAKTYAQARDLQRAVSQALNGFVAKDTDNEIILTRYDGIVGNEKEKDTGDYHIAIRFNILNK